MKTCSKCGETKDYSEFGKVSRNNDGLNCWCKRCMKEYREVNSNKIKSYAKKSYIKNSESRRYKRGIYYLANTEIIKTKAKEYSKKYYDTNKDARKNYAETHRDQTNVWRNNKRKTDIGFKLSENLRRRINLMITRNKTGGLSLVGLEIDSLKSYLENQFTKGMSWDNYGLYGWHIDHIRPCASFDLTDPEQQKQCFHYTNLQPLWAEDNLKKSDKLDWTKEAI